MVSTSDRHNRRRAAMATAAVGAPTTYYAGVLRHQATERAEKQARKHYSFMPGRVLLQDAKKIKRGTHLRYGAGGALGIVGAASLGTGLVGMVRPEYGTKSAREHTPIPAKITNQPSFLAQGVKGTENAVIGRKTSLQSGAPPQSRAVPYAIGTGSAAGGSILMHRVLDRVEGKKKLGHHRFKPRKIPSHLRPGLASVGGVAGTVATIPLSNAIIRRISPGYHVTPSGVQRDKPRPIRKADQPFRPPGIRSNRTASGRPRKADRPYTIQLGSGYATCIRSPDGKKYTMYAHKSPTPPPVLLDMHREAERAARKRRNPNQVHKADRRQEEATAAGAGAGALAAPGRRIGPQGRNLHPIAHLGPGVHQVDPRDIVRYTRGSGTRFGERAHVAAIAHRMKTSGFDPKAPPIHIHAYKDRGLLVDGTHRTHAAVIAGVDKVPVKIHHHPGKAPTGWRGGQIIDYIRTKHQQGAYARHQGDVGWMARQSRKVVKPGSWRDKFNRRKAVSGLAAAERKPKLLHMGRYVGANVGLIGGGAALGHELTAHRQRHAKAYAPGDYRGRHVSGGKQRAMLIAAGQAPVVGPIGQAKLAAHLAPPGEGGKAATKQVLGGHVLGESTGVAAAYGGAALTARSKHAARAAGAIHHGTAAAGKWVQRKSGLEAARRHVFGPPTPAHLRRVGRIGRARAGAKAWVKASRVARPLFATKERAIGALVGHHIGHMIGAQTGTNLAISSNLKDQAKYNAAHPLAKSLAPVVWCSYGPIERDFFGKAAAAPGMTRQETIEQMKAKRRSIGLSAATTGLGAAGVGLLVARHTPKLPARLKAKAERAAVTTAIASGGVGSIKGYRDINIQRKDLKAQQKALRISDAQLAQPAAIPLAKAFTPILTKPRGLGRRATYRRSFFRTPRPGVLPKAVRASVA